MTGEGGEDELPEEDLISTYGEAVTTVEQVISAIERKTAYKPWHHPVKQIVRARQWAALTKRLIEARTDATAKLRYFTLPGPDLLDVRVLAADPRVGVVQILNSPIYAVTRNSKFRRLRAAL